MKITTLFLPLFLFALFLGPIGCVNLPSRSRVAHEWMNNDLPAKTLHEGPREFGAACQAQFVQPNRQREAEQALAWEQVIPISQDQAEHFCGLLPQPRAGSPYLVRSIHALHVYTVLRVHQRSDGDVWIFALEMPSWFSGDSDPYPAVAWLERPPKKVYVTLEGMPR